VDHDQPAWGLSDNRLIGLPAALIARMSGILSLNCSILNLTANSCLSVVR
jgi:hypothetical protein